jgi:hypothetical protein
MCVSPRVSLIVGLPRSLTVSGDRTDTIGLFSKLVLVLVQRFAGAVIAFPLEHQYGPFWYLAIVALFLESFACIWLQGASDVTLVQFVTTLLHKGSEVILWIRAKDGLYNSFFGLLDYNSSTLWECSTRLILISRTIIRTFGQKHVFTENV